MLQYFDKLENDRDVLLEQTKDLSADQYNMIPPGSNNNIIWNMGHILVVGEDLLHPDSSDQNGVTETFKKRFRLGSKPDVFITEKEILYIRDALKDTAKLYKLSAGNDRSAGNNNLSNGAGPPASGDDLMRFILFHEQMHYRKIAKLMGLIKK
ncbi:DinB family protein [Mucilaginibacter roseus]|uniref:DinB family protein n=1 Tax=Mucilaginibacter roseus TaxID=1528868 RepID=A0ABS8TVX5_9SPHI|nr:DinB family protein [Mucilaginibacter roseus]MCD8739031.1 DinB family protein [Mucilaginibacter roseus]